MSSKRLLSLITAMFLLIIQLPSALAEEAKTMSIVSSSINDGANGISPVNLQLDVTFSEAVDTSTLTMYNVSVSGNAFAAVVSTGEKTATVYFDRYKIALGTKYTVTFKSGIKSASGAPLEETNITFTTVNEEPSYRQITNPHMDDANNIYGLESEAWPYVSITDDGGNNVLQFTPGWNDASVRQRVYCKSGRTYTARARIKATAETKARLVLTYNIPGEANNYFGSPDVELPPGEWVDLEYTWTVNNNADLSEVKQWIAVVDAGVTVYIDDWNFFEEGHDEDPPEYTADSSSTNLVSMGNDSLDKMKAFGIMPASISRDAELTRLDFAEIILKILGYDTIPYGTSEIGFTDVDEESMNIVSTIVGLGIMNGCSDTMFDPDSGVTFEQAIKVILNIMGWSQVAEAQGGYPSGYYQIGTNMGLLKNTGAASTAAVTYGALADIIDNALETEVLAAEYAVNNIPQGFSQSDTLLEQYFGYGEGEGIIEGTRETYLYSDSALPAGQVCINGETFAADADLSQYIGCRVRYYYDKFDENGNKLVYVYDIENRNNIAEISTINDIASFDNNTYTVWSGESGKKKQYRLGSELSIIYNGKYLGEYTNSAETFVPEYGTVRLIDSGSGYNTVIITDIRTIHVGSVDYGKEIIYDRLSDTSVDISDCSILSIKDKDGTEREINDIKQYNVLSVAGSKDGDIVKMYVSSDSLSGVVSGTADGDEPSVEIGDELYGSNVKTSYKAVKGFFDRQNVSAGMNGTFYFDYLGNVAAFTSGATSNNIGYLINAWLDEGETELGVKIFNTDGSMATLWAADNIRIDQTTHKTAYTALQSLMNGTSDVVSQLVMYDVNLDGEVSFIDTAYNKLPLCQDYRTVMPEGSDDADGFRVIYSSILPPNPSDAPSAVSFSPSARSFNGKVQMTEDAKIIYVPLNAKTDDKSKFYVSNNIWDLGDMGAEFIEAYQTNGGAIAVDTVVVYLPEERYMTNHIGEYEQGLVTDIHEEIVDDIPMLIVDMIDGTKLYAEDRSLVQNAEVGDYIRCRRDAYNNILEEADIILDISEKSVNGNNPYGSFGEWERMFFARICEKNGNILKIVSQQSDLDDPDTVLNAETVDISKAQKYVYLSYNKTIHSDSNADMLDYENSGSGASEIIVLYQDDVAQYVIVVE